MGREVTLEEMRAIQLDMLIKVDLYCQKRGLRYSLGGGTLLGAVRHQGYIPWDDDIDIMMPRTDYEIFIKEFDTLYENYRIQNNQTDSSFFLKYTKIFDNRSTLKTGNIQTGIFIDVFPIDGLPHRNDLRKFIRTMNRKQRLVSYTCNSEIAPVRFQFLRRIVPLFFNHETAVRNLNSFMASIDFETAQYAGAICGAYLEKEHMEASVFRNYTKLTFEGHEFQCIADYDAYLTQHYGNYMQLPPKESRVSNHDFTAYWKA